MTLQTPQILPINAFDPSYPYVIEFLYDDNQAVKNRLVITDNHTSLIVYDITQDGMRLNHTIPANSLQSSNSYIAQIQVWDGNGNQSNLSEGVLFYCYTTPSFYITGITNEELISKATLSVGLTYVQTEGETLKDFQFYLYNSDGSVRTYSNVLYPSQSPMNYTFYDLQNDTSYYIRAIGHTSHGMNLDTGNILFNVKYITIPANITFEVENNAKNGYITIFSGVIDIGYDVDNDDYLIENGAVKLWNDNKITYNKGFQIEGDFVLHLESKEIPIDKPFLMFDDGVYLSIGRILNDYYCKLNGINSTQYARIPEGRLTMDGDLYITNDEDKIIESITATYQNEDYLVYEIKRKNGIYGLKVYYKTDILEEG